MVVVEIDNDNTITRMVRAAALDWGAWLSRVAHTRSTLHQAYLDLIRGT